MLQRKITDDLQALLGVLPPTISKAVLDENNNDNLLEVILDLGRVPTARFVQKEVTLSQAEVTRAEIDYVVERVGEFDTDNRAGL
ncbi:MAG: AAA family ATPase, partial [Anaerolineales bacterium]